MSLYERLQETCIRQNITFKQLEREVGFGNGTLKKWEKQKPGYDKVLAVANKLQISLTWLITGKEAAELTEEEQRLVDYYRQADTRGKRRILQTAELEAQEQESSASKIG